MKKSLLLLMFALATVGFDAFGMMPAEPQVEPQDVIEGNAQENVEKLTIFGNARGLLTSKPAIIATVSAATAGATYAITKFINKKWNKQYNAKKAAALFGIGAGVITGVYLCWPVFGPNAEVIE